jgi:hypothetical protein
MSSTPARAIKPAKRTAAEKTRRRTSSKGRNQGEAPQALGDFEDLMQAGIPQARQVLREVLPGDRRIEFIPERQSGSQVFRLRWALMIKPLLGAG